jgi:hypothetical protein
MTFATVPIYISTLTLTKLSMLFFYRRIFENATTLLYVNITIGFVLVWGVAHFLANIFICNPVAGQYDLAVAATATCGNQITLFQSLIVTNIIGDIIIMILPMRKWPSKDYDGCVCIQAKYLTYHGKRQGQSGA